MRKYELSISADYVPGWGVTEAVREFFQNFENWIKINIAVSRYCERSHSDSV